MPVGLIQSLHAERDRLRTEGDAIRTLASAAGGYTDDQRERQAALLARIAQVDSDIAMESQAADLLREAPALAVADAVTGADTSRAPTPFRSIGEQFAAIRASALRPHQAPDPRLVAINEWANVQAAATGAGENVGADGGFLIQTDLAEAAMQRVYQSGALASRCKVINVGPNANGVTIPLVNETSRADGSRFGAVRAYWLDEGSSITASRPKFAQTQFRLNKLAGLFYAVDELLEDSTALDSIVDSAFTAELAFALDDAIYNGTGAGRPRGILNGNSTVSVAKETGQAAATIVAENVEKMFARLWAPSMRSAVWFVNQAVYPQLFQMQHVIGTGGVPVFLPPGGLSAAPFGTLFGRPIEPIEHAAALGTVGDISLLDLSQYYLVRKGGIAQAASIHVNFVQDETAFRWVMRVTGGEGWVSALTPYKGSDTLSPFVTLATRA